MVPSQEEKINLSISFPEPSIEPEKSEEEILLEQLRQRQEGELELLALVNPWNPIDEEYSIELVQIDENSSIAAVCAEALMNMLQDCTEAGNQPVFMSGYRTQDYQQGLYDNKIERLIAEGVPSEEAPAVAAQSVAIPGTSEHQLGLAADIVDQVYYEMDAEQENTGTQRWLKENCWRYGFILRYPDGTSDITGIIFEPWHYRYVGAIAAEEITKRGITLEEYRVLLYGE